MALSKENVIKIAQLSRLSFKEDEIEKFQKQLNDILAYVDKLGEVNTDGVEPLSHSVDIKNAFRSDVVLPSTPNTLAVKNAPQSEDGAFVVSKVVG